jgi:putative flippase GtrA
MSHGILGILLTVGAKGMKTLIGFLQRPGVALALLLGLSAVIHLALGSTARSNFWDNYAGRNYLSHAEALVQGDGYWGIRCCMPLYPLVLAGFLKLFGYASIPLLLLHTALGVTITWAGYYIGRTLFSPMVGLVAGLLLALHPYLVKLTMQIIDTGPSVALSSLGMVCLVHAWTHSSRARLYALAGIFLGLATLVRPVSGPSTIILAVAILGGSLLRRRLGDGVRSSTALVLMWIAVMSPYWIHNWVKYDTWIPLTSHGGLNVLKGHTPHYRRVQPLYDTDNIPYVDLPRVADDPGGVQSNRLRFQAALDYVRHHPAEAILTDLRKVVWLYGWHKVPRSFVNSRPQWDPVEHRVVDVAPLRPATQDVLYTIYWTPVLVLFVYGLWRSRARIMNLLPLYALLAANALTVALTFADTRYRLEADPLIAVLAAFGGVDVSMALWRRWQERRLGGSRAALSGGRLVHEFSVFLLVGGLSTLLQYVVLFVLVTHLQADVILASSVGFTVSALVNYALNYRLAFRSKRPHSSALPRFATIALVGLQLNWTIMYGATHWLGLHYVVAQVIATVIVLFWNFIGNALWSFGSPSRLVPRAADGRTRHA